MSDEKDVSGIKAKVFEARSSKSYESYEFIARYISPGSLMTLLEPIKKVSYYSIHLSLHRNKANISFIMNLF